MKLPWKSSVHYFAIAGSKNGVELKTEWPDAVPDHKTSKWLAPRGRMLIQILTVDDDLDECRVVFHVGIVLCVECGQRHQQRAAAGDIHLRRGTFEWRAGRVRSERVDDVLATILINKHQRYLQHSNAHHRYTASRESRGNNWCGYLFRVRCRLFAYGPADATSIPKSPPSLASLKRRLVLPFWYRLTQVVQEKRPLSGSVIVALVSKPCWPSWRSFVWHLQFCNISGMNDS